VPRSDLELMPSYGTRAVRFSVFEVDLRAGELRRTGVKVKLQNQPFQILSMLRSVPERSSHGMKCGLDCGQSKRLWTSTMG
jgi:hypothetical protein